jgi:hypothetical protein
MAATAAERWGLAPRWVPLDRPSCHGDGRDHRDHAPDAPVVHLTRGDRRDQRPDLHHGMLALMGAPHAGSPGLMQPLRGHSRDAPACGPVVQAPIAPLPTTYGTTDLGADSALYREDQLPTLSATRLQWIPRGPATVNDAHAALAQADPPTMAPRLDGSRARVLTSTSGGVVPRWFLVVSAQRQPQAQRTVDKPLLQRRAQDVNALKQRGRRACAWAADAPQALSSLAPS